MKKLICLIATLSFAGSVYGGERLNSTELKAFYTDKTVTRVHHKLGLSKTYYDTDGNVQSKSKNGTERVGKWWIEEDSSKHCIRWNHKAKDFCHYVEKNGDGSYTLIHGKKGKRLVEIQSTQEGHHL